MKTSSGKKQTKFIASLNDNESSIEEAARLLNDDEAVEVKHVSSMLGYVSGKATRSIEELQSKYQSKGLSIEPDRSVSGK